MLGMCYIHNNEDLQIRLLPFVSKGKWHCSSRFLAYNGQSYETQFSTDRRILASHEDPFSGRAHNKSFLYFDYGFSDYGSYVFMACRDGMIRSTMLMTFVNVQLPDNEQI